MKRQTERSWRLFKLKPQEFPHSENVFRDYTMEYVFRAQFGIKYDPTVRQTLSDADGERDTSKSWQSADSGELFIHGLLGDKRTGTCSSLPTFAIAVGRRLGYPLKLILVPNHTLYRWDDGKEVFNLQPHDAGGEVKPDEYFHTWPRKWNATDHQLNERTKVWLHSLTPRKEVSKFLCNRALMLRDTKRYHEAMEVIRAAERFDPVNPACADIEFSIQYGMTGGDVTALINGTGSVVMQGGSLVSARPLMETQFVGSPAFSAGTSIDSFNASPVREQHIANSLDARRWADRDFADEHYRLVNLINQSNRNRSPQHPDGNPPTEPLLRQLTQLLQNRKGR